MFRRRLHAAVLALSFASAAFAAQEKASPAVADDAAQAAPYAPAMMFDVASVRESKPDPSGWIAVRGGSFDCGRCAALR